MVITDLPVETLDHIAAAFDSPTDLANLGAVCTQLRLLVEPYHTQFRVIRAPLISPLWEKLATNRSLAQNVRILEVQSAEIHGDREGATIDEPVIPIMFTDLEVPLAPEVDNGDEDDVGTLRAHYLAKNATDLDAERVLVAALRGMSGLTSFRWSRTPPLVNADQEDDIWITIAKCCPSLNTIDVIDREKPYEPVLEETDDPAYQRPTRNPNFYLLRDLKAFSLKTEAFNVGNFAFPDFEQGGKMLVKQCPDLEVLKLQFVLYANPHSKTVTAAPLFSGPTWASLREINLFGFDFISTELSSFLISHLTIEVLSLTCSQIHGSLFLPAGALPCLKRLSTDAESTVTHSILNSTTSIPRPLESIMGSLLCDVFLDKLEQSGSGFALKKLATICSNNLNHLITRLSRIAPNLEWLNIRCEANFPINRSLYPVFGQLSHLRALHGVRFLDSNCEPASENTEAIRALATTCPKLRRIDWYTGGLLDDSLGIVIERNRSQVSWSLLKILRGTEGSVYTGWGERGCGSFRL